MASIVTPPTITYRSAKGSPLASPEIDDNFRNLANVILQLGSSLGLYLDTDSTWKPKVVPGSAIKDREITEAKLSLDGIFYKQDTGVANAVVVSFSPALTAYSEGLSFWFKAAASCTGASTINVDGLGLKDIKTIRGFDTTPGDIQEDRIHQLVYNGTEFVLVTTPQDPTINITTTVSTVNIKSFESTTAALPGANTAEDFAHGLLQVPESVTVVLICQSAELGYSVNDEVNVNEFFDTNKEPGFSVVSDNSKVSVVQNAGTIYASHLSTGTATAITNSNWLIKVRAKVLENTTAYIPPATEIMVANPNAAFYYNGDVWIYQHDRFSGSFNCRCIRQDLETNQVTFVHNTTTAYQVGQLFKFTAGEVKYVACDNGAVFMQDLDNSPHSRVVLLSTNLSFHRPIFIDDTSDPSHPNIYLAKNYPHASGDLTNAITFKTMVYSGSYTVADGTANLDLHNVNITNGAAFRTLVPTAATVTTVQINKFKRRIYVIEASSGFLHIFNYSATYANFADFIAEADGGVRHAELTYEKSIFIPSNGGMFYDGLSERPMICWDMASGAENYIVTNRRNNVSLYGSVSLGVWREG